MTGVLVVHEPGHLDGGAPWRRAFEDVGVAAVAAPDLPGHGAAALTWGGCYDSLDGALVAPPAQEGDDLPVVVGVGASGWSAQVLALGGRASALVLVDGLGGPWRDPRERIDAVRRWLRGLTDDPAAVAPAPADGPDPRAAHGVVDHGSRRLAVRSATAMPVPVLLVETGRSPLEPADVTDLAAGFAAGAEVMRVDDASPPAVAAVVADWIHRRSR